MPAIKLPYDIWQNVAQFLPQAIVLGLIAVNRDLFNIALDARYQQVWWVKLDKDMIRYLRRLQHPIIASHVRRLHIRAWFIQYLLKRDKLFQEGRLENAKSSILNPFKSLVNLSFLREQPEVESDNEDSFEERMASPREIMKAMIKAVNGMIHLTEYDFDWRDLPLNRDTSVFLTSARNTFASNLRKLVLRAQIPKFEQFLSMTQFEGLEEVDFHFDYHTPLEGVSASALLGSEEDVLLNRVAPFLNHLSTSLQALTISSSSDVDLSPLFNALLVFPTLRRFELRAPYEDLQLSDLSGLIRLLKAHTSTLLHVGLRPDRPQTVVLAPIALKGKPWAGMAEAFLAEPTLFKDLESLAIPAPSLKQTIRLIKRSADSLTRLSLLNKYLDFAAVSDILNIFSQRSFDRTLQHLHIEVKLVEAELFRLLASRLPNLVSLTIIYEEVDVPSNLTVDPKWAFWFSLKPISSLLRDWRLYDIGFHEKRMKETYQIFRTYAYGVDLLETQLAELVPSIRTFKGVPRPL